MGRRGLLWYRDLICLRSFFSLFKAITSELKTSWDVPHPKAFPFFYLCGWKQKETNLPELSYASAQRGGPRTVFSQWIKSHVQGHNSQESWGPFSELCCELVESHHLLLLEGVSGVCVCVFVSWAVAGINGLKLPSTFCSNSHVSGFPQLSWNPWFIISFVCEMFF